MTRITSYAHDAALWCPYCAAAAAGPDGLDNNPDWHPVFATNDEADCPQSCDACGEFLQNALTADGAAYVIDHIESWIANELANSSSVLADWAEFYRARITVTLD